MGLGVSGVQEALALSWWVLGGLRDSGGCLRVQVIVVGGLWLIGGLRHVLEGGPECIYGFRCMRGCFRASRGCLNVLRGKRGSLSVLGGI